MLARLSLFAAVTIAAPLTAQELLHYKFESNCGGRVINYAAGSPAPNEGTLVTNLTGAPATSWIQGQFGTGLQGGTVNTFHNYVDTGWVPGTITGSMTWACWLRMDPAAPTPSLTYLFGNGSTFRVFTGGGGFFLTASWGGTNVNTTTNVQTLARSGWTHVACVLDGSALIGTYYINGVPEAPVTMNAAVNWSGSNFYVGKHSSNGNASIFDLDEFLLVNRAMSAAEIVTLATSPRGADGAFGSTCGPTLDGNGQVPTLGNATYGLTVMGPPLGFAFLVFGSNRCSLGALPLPLDFGTFVPQLTGCSAHVANDIGVVSSFVQGTGQFAFPIPVWSGLSGYQLYAQALTVDAASSALSASNALAIAVGN